jgi:hypothetical protein
MPILYPVCPFYYYSAIYACIFLLSLISKQPFISHFPIARYLFLLPDTYGFNSHNHLNVTFSGCKLCKNFLIMYCLPVLLLLFQTVVHKHSRSGQVKFTLEQATKAQRGSRGIAVHFL